MNVDTRALPKSSAGQRYGRNLLLLFLSVLLAACGDSTGAGRPGTCLPTGIDSSPPQRTNGSSQTAKIADHVYYDISVSMAGYIDKERAHRTLYERGIDEAQRSLSLMGSQENPQLHIFGSCIHELKNSELAELHDSDNYTRYAHTVTKDKQNKKRNTKQEENDKKYWCEKDSTPPNRAITQQSRIDQVFDRIAANEDNGLHVVVSDLFPYSEDGDGRNKMFRSIEKAITGGKRSVAVLTVRSDYQGTVTDLPEGNPNERKGKREITGSRPFFLVVIGPLPRLQRYLQQLENNLFKGVKTADYHVVVFSPETFRVLPPLYVLPPPRDTSKGPISLEFKKEDIPYLPNAPSPGTTRGFREDRTLLGDAFLTPQLRLESWRDAVLKVQFNRPELPSSEARFKGKLQVKRNLWSFYPNGKCPSANDQGKLQDDQGASSPINMIDSVPPPWSKTQEDLLEFPWDSNEKLQELPVWNFAENGKLFAPSATYILTLELHPVHIELDRYGMAWLEDWSFPGDVTGERNAIIKANKEKLKAEGTSLPKGSKKPIQSSDIFLPAMDLDRLFILLTEVMARQAEEQSKSKWSIAFSLQK